MKATDGLQQDGERNSDERKTAHGKPKIPCEEEISAHSTTCYNEDYQKNGF